MMILGDFQGITGVTEKSKKIEDLGDIIYGCPFYLEVLYIYWILDYRMSKKSHV